MKDWLQKSKSKFICKTLGNYYSTIDELPAVRWDAIVKGGGYENLLVKKRKISARQKAELAKVWKQLNDEFISVFGFSSHTEAIINKKLKLARLMLKRIITGDDSISNFIQRAQKELDALTMAGGKSMDIYELKIIIERHNKGLYVPMDRITVREFHNYLKDIEKRHTNGSK